MTAFARALESFREQQPAEIRGDTDALVARMLAPLAQLQAENSDFPDQPALPEHSTDCTGVLTGNADLVEASEWRPWSGPSERAPLPIYPLPDDLPPPPCTGGAL